MIAQFTAWMSKKGLMEFKPGKPNVGAFAVTISDGRHTATIHIVEGREPGKMARLVGIADQVILRMLLKDFPTTFSQ